MSHLEQAVDLKAQLDALRPLNPDQEKRIWQKFRFDWNYHSNNIEGNSLTFGETKSLLLHNITAQGKPLKDHIEITGHNEAIDALVDLTRGDAPLTESFVRQLHELILRERYQVDAITPEGAPTRRWIEVGQYKTGQNHVQTVTGEIFRFAEPMDVTEKMHKLLQTVNELLTPSSAEVVLVAAKAHYDFVLIHPFDDGNGRMARLLMNLILIKYGFPPAIIKTEEKANYFSALRQADGGQFEVFIEYIAGCICASLQIMLAGARGESIEEPDEQLKKIALFAKLLNQITPRTDENKNRQSVELLFDKSFVPLLARQSAIDSAFQRIYWSINTSLKVGIWQVDEDSWEDLLRHARERLNADVPAIGYTVSYAKCQFQGFETIEHYTTLEITLGLNSYDIKVRGTDYVLERAYDVSLSEADVAAVSEVIVQEHLGFLEKATGRDLSA